MRKDIRHTDYFFFHKQGGHEHEGGWYGMVLFLQGCEEITAGLSLIVLGNT